MNRSAVVFCGIFFLFASPSIAQQTHSSDSAFYKEAVYHLYHLYFNQIGENAHLFNGSEYIRNGQRANGFPFFESNDTLPGSVSYQGVLYPDLNLQYDLVMDELITNNYQHNGLMKLSKEKVDSFSIESHHFIKLDESKTNGALKETGYYERLSGNEPAVFAKRVKKLEGSSGYEESKYVQYNRFYIKMKDSFYMVDGKNSLLDLFNDKRSLLKKFIRSNRLNFKKRPEDAIVRTTGYYSLLKP